MVSGGIVFDGLDLVVVQYVQSRSENVNKYTSSVSVMYKKIDHAWDSPLKI